MCCVSSIYEHVTMDGAIIREKLPYIPKDLTSIISEYAGHYKLLDWIDEQKLDYTALCYNYAKHVADTEEEPDFEAEETETLYCTDKALQLLSRNADKIDKCGWQSLCRQNNSKVLEFVSANVNRWVCHGGVLPELCWNHNNKAMDIVSACLERRLCTNNGIAKALYRLCSNPNPKATKIVCQFFDKLQYIGWYELCRNRTDAALELILSVFSKRRCHLKDTMENTYTWSILCQNTNDKAVELVSKNLEKLDDDNWAMLCGNTNDKAIQLLSKCLSSNPPQCTLDNKAWTELCRNKNPNAMDLLGKHCSQWETDTKIWKVVSMSPHIFKRDSDFLYKVLDPLMV